MAQRPVQDGLFEAGGLIAGRCHTCSKAHFPRAGSCPYCGGTGIDRETVGRTGTLYLHTVVQTAPPGYSGPVPYGFGLVDLPEGLRVITRLEAPSLEALHSGMALRLRIAPLFADADGDEVLSWSYEPADATAKEGQP